MAEMNLNVNTVWYGNAKGDGRIKANELQTKIAIPETLGGSGEGADPKGLLVSSAASCYLSTLVYMLQTKQLPVTGMIMRTEANNLKEGFSITHYPHIVLSANSTEEQIASANGLVEAADKACTVGNLLKKADVKIEIQGKVSLESDKDVVSEFVEEYGLDW